MYWEITSVHRNRLVGKLPIVVTLDKAYIHSVDQVMAEKLRLFKAQGEGASIAKKIQLFFKMDSKVMLCFF